MLLFMRFVSFFAGWLFAVENVVSVIHDYLG